MLDITIQNLWVQEYNSPTTPRGKNSDAKQSSAITIDRQIMFVVYVFSIVICSTPIDSFAVTAA